MKPTCFNAENTAPPDKQQNDTATAQQRAEELRECLAAYPQAWDAAMRYALGCVHACERIEMHDLVSAVKAAGGTAMPFNNNHIPLLTRMLAASSREIRNHFEFSGSMFDGVDVDRLAQIIRNQHR